MPNNQEKILIDKFNNLKLEFMENIKVGDALVCPIMWFKNSVTKVKTIKIFLIIVSMFIFDKYGIEIHGSPNTISFFASTYSRVDHSKYFNNFVKIFTNVIVLKPSHRKLALSNMQYLPLFYKWKKQINQIVKNEKESLYYLMFLLEAYILTKRYKDSFDKVNNLIVYCDFQPVDSYLVQFCNIKNINTISLQHGNYSSKYNIWFDYSYAKHVLASSMYAIDEAKKLGSTGDKFINTGFLPYIGRKIRQRVVANHKNIIGLFLDGESLRDSNIKMIENIKAYCDLYNTILFIMPHPTANNLSYKMFETDKCHIESNNGQLQSFFDKVDVTIVANSTVLYDCLIENRTTFIYNFDNKTVYEDELFYPLLLQNYDDLVNKLCKGCDAEVFNKIRDYLVGDCKDIKGNYVKALKMIGVKI